MSENLNEILESLNQKFVFCDLTNQSDQTALIDGLRALKEAAGFPSALINFVDEIILDIQNSVPIEVLGEKFAKLDLLLKTGKGTGEDTVDEEFAEDLIAKYNQEFPDFLDTLAHQLQSEESEEELAKRNIKSFVHTLKGDAGSVGFSTIEKACHKFEEVLPEINLMSAYEKLVSLKDFCFEIFDSWKSSKQVPSKSWEPPEAVPVPNFDLLKELANDPEFKDYFKKAPQSVIAEASNEQIFEQSSEYYLEGDPGLFDDFYTEAGEHLSNLEEIILGEVSEGDVNEIFRAVHSIKGASGYFKFREVTELSHILENILDRVRQGEFQFNQTLKQFVINYVDLVRESLSKGKRALANQEPLVVANEALALIQEMENFRSGKTAQPSYQATKPQISQPVETKQDKDDSQRNLIKVDTQRLDHLIDNIGEMCIYTNMLIEQTRRLLKDNIEVIDIGHQVEKFSRELQSVGIALRLVPIKGLFQKMSRMVWDLSRKIGKEVKCEIYGEETELDRTIIEKLTDPLMHMVRNSVDHGIELPDERQAKGKPRVGKIKLSAFQKGGTINIVIEDDGKGINSEKVYQKALEKGIINPGIKLEKNEILSLIFAPGFSTADKVTEISGRGVGMDVVRRNVSDLRGRIMVDSEEGKGTRFTIELPLTLAILDGIQFKIGGEIMLAPTLSVVEIVQPDKKDIFHAFDKGCTYNFRGSYVPVFDLSKLFNIPSQTNSYEEGRFLIVESGSEKFALFVDEVLESFTTVIKSVDDFVGNKKGISGCCVLSNGQVALIIDVREILELARKQERGVAGVSI